MTTWVAYVPAGMEFALVEDCDVLGIKACAPRKVEAVRTGNKRWPEKRGRQDFIGLRKRTP